MDLLRSIYRNIYIYLLSNLIYGAMQRFQTRENSVKRAITYETLKPVSMALYQGPGIPAGKPSKPIKSLFTYLPILSQFKMASR